MCTQTVKLCCKAMTETLMLSSQPLRALHDGSVFMQTSKNIHLCGLAFHPLPCLQYPPSPAGHGGSPPTTCSSMMYNQSYPCGPGSPQFLTSMHTVHTRVNSVDRISLKRTYHKINAAMPPTMMMFCIHGCSSTMPTQLKGKGASD